MKEQTIEYQECSKEVYDILVAFNNLPSEKEQKEVLDVIYDIMYGKSYRKVMSDRIILLQTKKIEELMQTIVEREGKIVHQKELITNLLSQQGVKKKLYVAGLMDC